MAELNRWDKRHLVNLGLTQRQIDRIFEAAAKEAAAIGASLHDFDPDKPFSFADYPQTRERIEKALKELGNRMETVVVNGVRSGWTLANNKNNALCDYVFGENKYRLSKAQERRYYSNNDKALEAFTRRKEAGLNLSDRVWNYTSQFKAEIEMGLDLGIRGGLSAAEMARDLQQYLKYPDRLYRRFRFREGTDEEGKATYGKKWKQRYFDEASGKYKYRDVDLNDASHRFGKGVYRSSYKNALRLARTEVNMAYRSSDHERWQQLDFVVGIEVRLSNNHTLNGKPFEDICDALAGKYPKTFKFTGWHPQCRCHAVSILKTPDELMRDMDGMVEGEDVSEESVNAVRDVPEGFKKWVAKNGERIAKAEERGTLPYFVKDNKDYVLDNGKQSFAAIFTEKTYAQEFVDYANNKDREDIPKRGLVNDSQMYYHSPDSVNKDDLEMLLENYFNIYKNDVTGKFGGVSVKDGNTCTMECVRDNKDINHLHIFDHNYRIATGLNYNANTELFNALQMIRNGKTLTFKEEYAIENLWHELLHGKSAGLSGKKLSASQNNAMEAINQFVARKSYPEFLKRLGGEAVHKDKIFEDGFGYGNSIANLMKCFKKCKIEHNDAFKFFETKIVSSKYEDIEKILYNYLKQNGLKSSETVFKKMMTDLYIGENEFAVKYLSK